MQEFNQLVQQRLVENPHWRKGQATFLVAWDHFTGRLQPIITTDRDPFYSDDKIQDFMVYLVDNGFFNEA